MATLILSAPRGRVRLGSPLQTFEDMYIDGVGRGFIIEHSEFSQLNPGDKLILLSNDEEKRATAKLKEVRPADKASNGKQRYDVFFDQQKPTGYEYSRVGRNGVAVI